MDRSELINFIADLAGPIDPSVFAGFGSKVQMRISSNSLAGEKIKTEWVSKADAVAALDVLFDIACNPPDETVENNFYAILLSRNINTIQKIGILAKHIPLVIFNFC